MSASGALQKAIFDALSADATLTGLISEGKIFDYRLEKTDMPYLVIDSISSREFLSDTESGQTHELLLQAWSAAKGHKQVQDIAAAVRQALHDRDLDLQGFHLVNLRLESVHVRRHPKSGTHLAQMRFRAVTE